MNYEDYEKVTQLERDRREKFIETGLLLLKNQKEEDFLETLADPLVLFSRNQIYEIGLVYKHFIENLTYKIEDLSLVKFSRLVQMIPITNKENAEEWLEKGAKLGPEDFKLEIREAKGLKLPEQCPHSDRNQYAICNHCGVKEKLT